MVIMSVYSNDGWCSCCWWCVSIFNCCSRFEKSTYVLTLSVLKSLHAGWLIDAYDHLTSEVGRKIIANGRQAAETTSALSKGVQGLPTLGPFDTIDPLVNHADESDSHLPNMYSEEINFFINLRGEEEDSSDDEWEMEDTGVEIRNAFDMFLDNESDE